MTLIIDQTTGLEEISREILLILVDGLNTALVALETDWTVRDQALATATNRTYVAATLEPVLPEHFYLGHRPSLLEATVDQYPNISVMGDSTAPGGDQEMDLFHGLQDHVFIEVMCKAGPYDREDWSYEGEELVNRRIQRTANAVNITLMKNRTLNGLVSDLPVPPEVNITPVFAGRESKGRGPRWIWQGARLDYNIVRIAQAF